MLLIYFLASRHPTNGMEIFNFLRHAHKDAELFSFLFEELKLHLCLFPHLI